MKDLKISRYHEKYLSKTRAKQKALLDEVNIKQAKLQESITEKYSKWRNSIQQKVKLDSMGLKISDAVSINELQV